MQEVAKKGISEGRTISYTSGTEHMLYVLHLAVSEEIRSKGYGAKILQHLKEISGTDFLIQDTVWWT